MTTFKKTTTVAAALAFAASAAISSGASAAEKWSMATPWSGGPLLEYLAKGIGKEIELVTNKEIEVEVFPGGTLGKALNVSDAVKKGIAKIGHNWAGYDWGADRTAVLFAGYSGTMPWEKMAHWYFRGGGAELLMEWRLDKFNVASVPCGSQPPEVFLHSHKKISSLADFQGVKVRTSGAWAEIAQTLGASTVILPGSEVYPALERKVVDGIEWGTPFMNESAGYEKIAKYIIVPGIHQPDAFHECVVNKAAWDGLDDRTKELIKRAGQTYFFNFWLEVGDKDAPAFQNFVKNGHEIVELDAEFKKAAKEATAKWAEDQAKGNEWFRKVYDHQQAYAATWSESHRYRNVD